MKERAKITPLELTDGEVQYFIHKGITPVRVGEAYKTGTVKRLRDECKVTIPVITCLARRWGLKK